MVVRSRIPAAGWAALVAGAFAVNVWRAATVPVTHDEALTYLRYVAGGWPAVFRHLDANNHVLHTILCKLIVDGFGLGLMTLRAASLIGTLFFLAGAARIAAVLGRGGAGSAVLFGLTVANPLVLRELPLARGYSLGLAFFVAGLLALLRGGFGRRKVHPVVAGVAFGLSIAANLTLLFPCVGALAGAFWLFRLSPRSRESTSRAWIAAAAPAACLAAAILALPVSHAFRAGRLRGTVQGGVKTNYYVGTQTVSSSAQRLLGGSLGPRATSWAAMLCLLLVLVVILLALALGARNARRPRFRAAVLLSFSLFGAAAILAVLHASVGLPLPQERTGLAFLVLVPLAWAASIPLLPNPVRRAVARASVVAGALLLAQFVRLAVRTRWNAPDSARMIGAARPPRETGGAPVRVSASWFLAPTLEFSRRLLRVPDVAPLEYRIPTCIDDFDVFALTGHDLWLVFSERLDVVYRDPRITAVVATRRERRPERGAPAPCAPARIHESWSP